MTALIGLITSILGSLVAALGFIVYWIIGPILLYIAVKIFLAAIRFSDWRSNRNWAPRRGYTSRRRKWYEK